MFDIEFLKENDEMKTGVIYQTKNGLMRKVKNEMYEAVVPVQEFRNLKDVKTSIDKVFLPKIPYDLFMKIYGFFKHIYNEHKSEVAVLLWYNFKTKEWEVEVPKQTVSAASVKYTSDENYMKEMRKKGFMRVGSIHSHCEMGAFHSGVDDDDEFGFDGVHITIGKVISGPEFAQRFIVKDMAVKFEKISDCVDMPMQDTKEFPKEWNKQVSKTYAYNKDGNLSKWYSGYGKIKETVGYGKDESDDKLTNMEKDLRIAKLKRVKKNKVWCPLCGEKTRIGKGRKCTKCGFPLWANPDEYDLVAHDNDNTFRAEKDDDFIMNGVEFDDIENEKAIHDFDYDSFWDDYEKKEKTGNW